ncbi:MAG: hypothetical protein AB8G95_03510 [Anaerolineae bacterium]
MTHSVKRHLYFVFGLTTFLVLSTLPILGLNSVWAAGDVHYVDASAAGSQTGDDWANAYTTLQGAIDEAVSGDEIWVAAGVYKPTKETNVADARTATFQLTEGVAIYGGFAGDETDRTDRDWDANQTVLSGDLDNNDLNVGSNNGVTVKYTDIIGDNAYNIVRGNDAITYTNATVLDGFTLTGGFTKSGGADYQERDGAAIRFIEYASPILRNLVIVGNISKDDGGAIHFLHNSSPILENVYVESVKSEDFGGGIYFESNNNPTFSNVTVIGTQGKHSAGIYLHDHNTATFANLYVCGNVSLQGANGGGNGGSGLSLGSNNVVTIMNGAFSANVSSNENGGGIRMKGNNTVDLHNVSVSGNQANNGGGIYFRDSGNNVTLTNSVVWGNSSEIDNGSPVSLAVSYSLIGNGASPYSGTGNVASTTSPFVLDPEDGTDNTWGTTDDDCGDLRLKLGATSVNSGSNADLPADSLDINNNGNTAETLPIDLDGEFRVYSTTVDMGAYEISVAPTAQTITFTLLPEAESGLDIDDSTTLTATASSGLPVEFSSNTPLICSVTGDVALMLAGGTCSVTASQGGDNVYGPAPDVIRTISVSKQDQTLTITSPATDSNVFVGDDIALVASATSGLDVVFTSGTPSVCTVSGATATMTAAGTCTIDANQPGNGIYNAALEQTVSLDVSKQGQTINFIQPASGTTSLVGDELDLIASSDSGLIVAIESNTPTICSVSGDKATLLAEGSCELVASQDGNSVYNAAAPVSRFVAVGNASKTNQTITFSSPALLSEAAKNDVIPLVAIASSGLATVFSTNTPLVCSVTGTMAIMADYGSCQIIASQAGDATYNAAPSVVHTVHVKKPQSIDFPTPPSAQQGETITLTATSDSGLLVSFVSLTPTVCSISGDMVELIGFGLCQIEARQIGNDEWLEADVSTITFSVASNGTTGFSIYLPLVGR